MGLGNSELLIVVFIILLLFGSRRLPELAKAMGGSVKEFKEASEYDSSMYDRNLTQKEKVLSVARSLGIETEGKGLEEINIEISSILKKMDGLNK